MKSESKDEIKFTDKEPIYNVVEKVSLNNLNSRQQANNSTTTPSFAPESYEYETVAIPAADI